MKGFRRSVNDVGYRDTDKNEILLKIVYDEGVPRIEIKLNGANGYSKQHKSSGFKLNKKTENEKPKFYIQFDNESALNNLLAEPSYSSNDIDYDYKATETSVSVLQENDNLHYESTLNTNGLLLNGFHNSFLTLDHDARTISYDHTTYTKLNVDSTGLINNLTMLGNGETDAIETVTIKFVNSYNNNLTRNGSTTVITTPLGGTNADQLLKNVDKYRKIYSHSFYQRDKSEPSLAKDVSQVTSDFLLHFLPLVVSHTLPRTVSLMNISNGSNNENFEINFDEYKNFLKSSPILEKLITVSSINTKTTMPYSDYELSNNNKMNHHKISNTTDDITSDYENIMYDSTFKITFLRKDLGGTSLRFPSPNMSIVKVTPVQTNVNNPRNWSFSNSDKINYNVTIATPAPRVEKETNVTVNVGFSKGNNSSTLSQNKKKVYVQDIAATKTIIESQRKNFNMFNNKISTASVSRFTPIKRTTFKNNDMRTNWFNTKNKTFRKLGRRHFFETPALKPLITITYINPTTSTISHYLPATNSSQTEIYPIL